MKVLLAGALALASIEAHACTDVPGCAVVTKTPDGFLNLRRAPTTRAPVVTKLRPGDRLYITVSDCIGKWKLIEGVWRLDGKPINIEAGSEWVPHSGWVATRFLREITCPKEMQR